MAKGLKVGDAVTVRKDMRLRRIDPAYQQGLKSIKSGEIGHVVSAGNDGSRSVVVEFKGVPVKLASQRLDRATPPVVTGTEVPDAEQPAQSRRGRRRAAAELGLLNYNNPDFIAEVANRLLMAGGAEPSPETVVVQVKLSDLPAQVQRQVQSLMRAKLDLGKQPRTPRRAAPAAAQAKPRGRRGRKPKTAQT
jgi:hypothetical protein